MWPYTETLAAAKRERDRIAAMSDEVIAASLDFFTHPKLLPHYSGLLHDLKREQDRRLQAWLARNSDTCVRLQAKAVMQAEQLV